MNKRIVFSTDLTLAIVWPITLATGLIIHAAGHGIVQQGVQLWTALHTLFGILFFTASLLHIKAHWRWYKSLVRGNKCHSKITMGLSVACLLADNRHCHYSHIAKRSRRYTLGPITLSGRYFIQHFGIMSPDQSPEVSTESLLPRKVKALPPPLEVDIPASLKYILFLIL